jgi:RHS repeat-associated protein
MLYSYIILGASNTKSNKNSKPYKNIILVSQSQFQPLHPPPPPPPPTLIPEEENEFSSTLTDSNPCEKYDDGNDKDVPVDPEPKIIDIEKHKPKIECISINESYIGNEIIIKDMPFSYPIAYGPDIFIKYKYISDAADDSVMGEKVEVNMYDTSICYTNTEDELYLYQGPEDLTLNESDALFTDSEDIYAGYYIDDTVDEVILTNISRNSRYTFEDHDDNGKFRLKKVELYNDEYVQFYYDDNRGGILTNISEIGGVGRKALFTIENDLLKECAVIVNNSGSPLELYKTTFKYDNNDRLTNVIDMVGNSTAFKWDVNNNILTQIVNSSKRIDIINNTVKYYHDPTVSSSSYTDFTKYYNPTNGYGSCEIKENGGKTYKTEYERNEDGKICKIYQKMDTGGNYYKKEYYAYDDTTEKVTHEWTFIESSGSTVDYSTWQSNVQDDSGSYAGNWDKQYVYYGSSDSNGDEGKIQKVMIRHSSSRIATNTYGYYKYNDINVPLRYRGKLKWTTNAVGVCKKYEYSVNNNIYTERTIEDPGGIAVTNITYKDSKGRATYFLDALHTITTNIYYDTIDQALDTSAKYKRLRYSIRKYGSSNQYSETNQYDYGYYYDSAASQYLKWEASKSHYQGWVTNYYDANGREIMTYYPDGIYELRTYGCCSQVQSITRGNDSQSWHEVSYEYDGLGQVKEKSYYYDHPDITVSNLIIKYYYDAAGNVVSIAEYAYPSTTALSTSTNIYDKIGRLVEQNGRSKQHIRHTMYNAHNLPLTNIYIINDVTGVGLTTINDYYDDGRLRNIISPGNRTNSYIYDLTGNIITNYDAINNYTVFVYDSLGRKTNERYYSSNNNGGEGKTYLYDKNGKVIKEYDERGNCRITEYDKLGRVTAEIVDMNDNGSKDSLTIDSVTQYTYENEDGNLKVTTTGPLGNQYKVLYDNKGLKWKEYYDSDKETEYEYNDPYGRVTKIYRPTSGINSVTESYCYDSNNLRKYTDVLERVTTYNYDGLDRRNRTTNANNNVQIIYYKSQTDLISQRNSNGINTYYFYDNHGRLTNIINHAGNRHSFTEYNNAGQVSKKYGNDIWPVTNTYYNDGTTRSITDSEGNTTRFSYDYRGRLKQRKYADDTHCDFTYYNNGLVHTRTNADGTYVVYSYDTMGNVTNINYSDSTPDVYYTYNLNGQKTKLNDGSGMDTYWSYYTDTTKPPLNKGIYCKYAGQQSEILSLHYTYWDHNNARKTLIFTNDTERVQKLTYTYDDFNRLTSLQDHDTDAGAGNFTYAYDNSGVNVPLELKTPIESGASNNYVIQEYIYDNWGKKTHSKIGLVSLLLEDTTTNYVDSREFTYNNDHQCTNQTFLDDAEVEYAYDMYGQLTNAYKYVNSQVQTNYMFTYLYNGIGNRTNEHRNDVNFEFSHNNVNQMTQRIYSAQHQAIKYDLNGNMTNDTSLTYVYNAENRLTEVRNSSNKYVYYYDGLGRKVKVIQYERQFGGKPPTWSWVEIKTTIYHYDGWNCIAESEKSGSVLNIEKTYVWGTDVSGSLQGAGGVGGLISVKLVDEGMELLYCYDCNGNVIRLIDISSTARETVGKYEYDPYGCLLTSSGTYKDYNDYRFSTKRYESLGDLYNYGYRHYCSDLGRWISRDPINEKGGFNLYGFVYSNPIKNIDILGNIVKCHWKWKFEYDHVRWHGETSLDFKENFEYKILHNPFRFGFTAYNPVCVITIKIEYWSRHYLNAPLPKNKSRSGLTLWQHEWEHKKINESYVYTYDEEINQFLNKTFCNDCPTAVTHYLVIAKKYFNLIRMWKHKFFHCIDVPIDTRACYDAQAYFREMIKANTEYMHAILDYNYKCDAKSVINRKIN